MRVAQVFYRLPFLIQAFQVDIVAVYAFIERTDRYAAVGGKERHADITAAEAESAGGCLVVFYGKYGYLRFPVGGDEAYFRSILHNVPRTVGQLMQYGRIGSHKLCFDGIFLEHQVVTLQFHVGIGVTLCQVVLYFIHIVYKVVR